MIPRIIHQVWVGGTQLPDRLKRYTDEWARLHPSWEYRLWGDDDLDWLELRELYDQAEERAPYNQGQFRSNIARVEILHHFGGLYADADEQPLRPFDDLLEASSDDKFTTFWMRPSDTRLAQYVANALMWCAPGHPASRVLIDRMTANADRLRGRRSTYTTGIRYVSRILEGRSDVVVLPGDLAYPYQPQDVTDDNDWATPEQYPDAYAVHHWNNLRSGGRTGPWACDCRKSPCECRR